MSIFGLIVIVVVLGIVAYVVEYMKLPNPYGRIVQLLLLCGLIYAIVKFAFGQGVAF